MVLRMFTLALTFFVLDRSGMPASAGGASVEELVRQLKKPNAVDRQRAIIALGEKAQAAKPALPALLNMYRQPALNAKLFPDLYRAVERIGLDRSAVPGLLAELQKRDTDSQVYSKLLGIVGEPAVAPLLDLLDHDDPVIRTKALRALANCRDLPAGVVPRLSKCLDDADAVVRNQAAGTLSTMGPLAEGAVPDLIKALKRKNTYAAPALNRIGPAAKDAVPALRAALKDMDTSSTRYEINASDVGKLERRTVYLAADAARALGGFGADAQSAADDLLTATRDPRSAVRLEAVKALGRIRAAKAIPGLMEILEKTAPAEKKLHEAAAGALGEIGEPARLALLKAIERKNPSLRFGATMALAKMRPLPEQAIAALRPYLKDSTPSQRAAVLGVLRKLGIDAKDAMPDLMALLADKSQTEDTRKEVAAVLAEIGAPAGASLLEAAKHDLPDARRWTAIILGKMKSPPDDAVGTLTVLLSDAVPAVRSAAAQSLGEFGPSAKAAADDIEQLVQSDPSAEVRRTAAAALKKIRIQKELP